MIASILKDMDMQTIDIDKVKCFLREKENRARLRKEEELNKIIKNLKDLENVWKKYGIKRVYLYGSVTEGRIHHQSDIDIAVEGNLSYRELLHLFGEVDKQVTREIDLRNIDELPFKEIIKKKRGCSL